MSASTISAIGDLERTNSASPTNADRPPPLIAPAAVVPARPVFMRGFITGPFSRVHRPFTARPNNPANNQPNATEAAAGDDDDDDDDEYDDIYDIGVSQKGAYEELILNNAETKAYHFFKSTKSFENPTAEEEEPNNNNQTNNESSSQSSKECEQLSTSISTQTDESTIDQSCVNDSESSCSTDQSMYQSNNHSNCQSSIELDEQTSTQSNNYSNSHSNEQSNSQSNNNSLDQSNNQTSSESSTESPLESKSFASIESQCDSMDMISVGIQTEIEISNQSLDQSGLLPFHSRLVGLATQILQSQKSITNDLELKSKSIQLNNQLVDQSTEQSSNQSDDDMFGRLKNDLSVVEASISQVDELFRTAAQAAAVKQSLDFSTVRAHPVQPGLTHLEHGAIMALFPSSNNNQSNNQPNSASRRGRGRLHKCEKHRRWKKRCPAECPDKPAGRYSNEEDSSDEDEEDDSPINTSIDQSITRIKADPALNFNLSIKRKHEEPEVQEIIKSVKKSSSSSPSPVIATAVNINLAKVVVAAPHPINPTINQSINQTNNQTNNQSNQQKTIVVSHPQAHRHVKSIDINQTAQPAIVHATAVTNHSINHSLAHSINTQPLSVMSSIGSLNNQIIQINPSMNQSISQPLNQPQQLIQISQQPQLFQYTQPYATIHNGMGGTQIIPLEALGQSINQSINPSMNQTINQSAFQPVFLQQPQQFQTIQGIQINQPINQSMGQAVHASNVTSLVPSQAYSYYGRT